MKRFTEKKAATYCNRVLTAARNPHNIRRDDLANGWTDNAGRYLVTDAFRAYRLARRPDGIEDIPVNISDDHDYTWHMIASIFDPLDTGRVVEIAAPDMNAVKLAIKDGNIFDLGFDKPACNARYLREVSELLPGAKWFVSDHQNCVYHPVFAVSANGAALVLPLRIK